LQKLIEIEGDDEDMANFNCFLHLSLMRLYSSPEERIAYLDTKWDYLHSLERYDGTYSLAAGIYIADALMLFEVEKILDIYPKLPEELQKDKELYFNYGFANYIMAIKCENIMERDIYVYRAVNIFKRLKEMGFPIGEFMDGWLKKEESL